MSDKDEKKSRCKCPYCDEEIEEESILCSACKIEIVYCSNCGKPVVSTVGKCPNCGTSIK